MGRQEKQPRLDPAWIADTLAEIEGFGNRYHGSVGEARCRDYMAARFEEVGLEGVRLEPFKYLAYEGKTAICEVLTPSHRPLECRAVQFSADGVGEGEPIYLGAGEAEDFERLDLLGVDLAGRVVVVQTIAPFLLAPLLADRSIAALVNVSTAPEEAIGNYTAALYPVSLEPPWDARPVSYPAVTVAADAGRELLSLMTSGRAVSVRVEHRAHYLEKTAHNVVGHLAGASDEEVIVGGHYDSQAEGAAVWDNATGCASILEIARVLAGEPLTRTLTVVAFAVEEVGLWGSAAYTARHADELHRVAAMVNLDAVASSYPAKRAVWADEAMREFAALAARESGWEPQILFDARKFQFSDNTPFTEAGVPSCWIWCFPAIHPYYHTSGDVTELVDPVAVAETAGASAAVAQSLLTDSTLSLGRASAVV